RRHTRLSRDWSSDVCSSDIVADAQDGAPDDLGDVRVRLSGDLAGDVDLTGGDQRLDGHATARILCEQRVETAVTDLVRDLVRVRSEERSAGKEGIESATAAT